MQQVKQMLSKNLFLIGFQRKATVSRVGVCMFCPSRANIRGFDELLNCF